MFGVERNKVLGAALAAFLAPECRDACFLAIGEVLRTGQQTTREFALAGRERPLFARLEIAPLEPHAPGAGCRATITDISDRKAAEEALQKAKAAAEAANEAKNQFLANMSHELRTPLNVVLGMVELALPRQADPAAKDFLETAKSSADLLLAELSDLLDLTKIEAGMLELDATAFSLRHVVQEVAQALAPQASAKGLALSCSIGPEVPDALTGDQVRLRQVLLNLAANAVKFTERGEVEIRVRHLPAADGPSVGGRSAGAREGSAPAADSPHPNPLPKGEGTVGLEFTVRDTGIGIPPAQLERIFQRFAQADASTTRRYGGSGLGLAISSSLIAMMGGRIGVESELGRGSTFSFGLRLPLAKDLPAPRQTGSSVSPAPAAKLRILLAEDTPANQKLAAFILRERGHTVEIAEDGEQSLRMAEEDFDVILMDVSMPRMDGLDAAKAIRAREQGRRRVPIIAMTAHAMKEDRDRCLAAGMDAYLSKPIDRQKMIDLVERLAAGAVGRRAN
jgi:signal transduction histidine kinase/ActR/RegA family two-component response regulator